SPADVRNWSSAVTEANGRFATSPLAIAAVMPGSIARSASGLRVASAIVTGLPTCALTTPPLPRRTNATATRLDKRLMADLMKTSFPRLNEGEDDDTSTRDPRRRAATSTQEQAPASRR